MKYLILFLLVLCACEPDRANLSASVSAPATRVAGEPCAHVRLFTFTTYGESDKIDRDFKEAYHLHNYGDSGHWRLVDFNGTESEIEVGGMTLLLTPCGK